MVYSMRMLTSYARVAFCTAILGKARPAEIWKCADVAHTTAYKVLRIMEAHGLVSMSRGQVAAKPGLIQELVKQLIEEMQELGISLRCTAEIAGDHRRDTPRNGSETGGADGENGGGDTS